jgi:hypothetical protein
MPGDFVCPVEYITEVLGAIFIAADLRFMPKA